MYGLFGKLRANPGQRDMLLDQLMQGSSLMNDVPGCHLYVLNTAADDPDGIWVYEAWETKADHDESLNHEAVRAIISTARPYIAGFGERFEFTPVGGLGL
jgi:quinol monooxygenase YgiN